MSVGYLLRRAASLPPHLLIRETRGFVQRQARARMQRRADRLRSSYADAAPPGALNAYVTLGAADIPDDLAAALPAVVARILDHRFDLLGSGWTAVHHGADCRGVEGVRYPPGPRIDADRDGAWLAGRLNAANLPEAQRLWRLVDRPDYRPIDWQLDFKSGYRWSERSYFLDIAYGHAPGADIKVPWELARLQHLPWLAVAYVLALAGRPGFAPAARYVGEIRSQILDFLATNPPRFGVNWRCPMDVAIRIANALLALDILRGAGMTFDAPFREAVARAALEHGRHIAGHLEWAETGRSNHYLSDIVGLLFVAAYLPRSPETDAWLAFAIRQIGSEIETQFGADGGNYEGSTAYHGLSAELAAYAAALILGLPEEKRAALLSYDCHAIDVRPPFDPAPLPQHDLPGAGPSPLPPESFARIAGMARFLSATTKPTGRILQVGDTNSGRLFKLHPTWHATEASDRDEDILDRRGLGAALEALFAGSGSGGDNWLDAVILRRLAKDRTVVVPVAAPAPTPHGDLAALLEEIGRLPSDCRRVIEIPIPGGIDPRDGLFCDAFPDFGLYLLRGPRLFLALRCAGHARGDAPTGHTHDDNLALELQIDGRDGIADPGSYLYTPFPAMRERYRAVEAHFVPRPVGRRAAVPAGLFALRHVARATCLHCGTGGLAGRLDAPDWRAWRVIELLPGAIRVTDACTPGPLAPAPAEPATDDRRLWQTHPGSCLFSLRGCPAPSSSRRCSSTPAR